MNGENRWGIQRSSNVSKITQPTIWQGWVLWFQIPCTTNLLRSYRTTRWNPVSTKNTKISWAWWCAPVIPATQEAEAGESLELGRQRLQCHCTSAWATERDSASKNKRKEIKIGSWPLFYFAAHKEGAQGKEETWKVSRRLKQKLLGTLSAHTEESSFSFSQDRKRKKNKNEHLLIEPDPVFYLC